MHVKGNAWLARVEEMTREVGAAKWEPFIEAWKPKVPFLASQVLPISRIPVEEFLAVNDALVEHFFSGDDHAYWRFGVASAQWALTHQLRNLFAFEEGRRFLQFTPTIYKNYFDGGELLTDMQPEHVDIIIRGVRPPHVYFEYSIIGFAQGGLAELGVMAEPEVLEGFSKGDAEVRYRFAVHK